MNHKGHIISNSFKKYGANFDETKLPLNVYLEYLKEVFIDEVLLNL